VPAQPAAVAVAAAVTALGTKDGVEFVAFLLASSHAQLHLSSAAALRKLRSLHKAQTQAQATSNHHHQQQQQQQPPPPPLPSPGVGSGDGGPAPSSSPAPTPAPVVNASGATAEALGAFPVSAFPVCDPLRCGAVVAEGALLEVRLKELGIRL